MLRYFFVPKLPFSLMQLYIIRIYAIIPCGLGPHDSGVTRIKSLIVFTENVTVQRSGDEELFENLQGPQPVDGCSDLHPPRPAEGAVKAGARHLV
jgi:hypothetical protein